MKLDTPFCTFNTGTSITCPSNKNIYVVAANAGFTAEGEAIAISAPISFTVPLKLSTNITAATAKTIFYYIGD
ncbi:hypothetical protein OAE74_00895 [Verrucomicrobia bacterium]|nr:hypothetical protein [Verrucomicrobiota bacterium]|tara:strand:- start:805 stop:1023 length:219 start_codon:yes stop_codon:yes gene_type:complete